MSELQSISNGTYMIGETSDLNFEAGPGISITHPSEGTVRISNDETVLWSGAVTGSAFSVTLSEDCQNFEKLQFIGGTNSSPGHPMYGQTYTNDLDANGKIQCSMLGFDPSHIKVTIMELSGTNLKSVQMFEDDILNTAAGTLKNNFYIYKVIGIDRKENA